MLATYARLLARNRNFRLLWLAQVVSELGDWFYSLSVYSLLLELTGGHAQSVGLAVVLQVLPQTFAAPVAGVINDRMHRKAILIGADIGRFVIVLGMLGVRTPGMVWLVYPLLLLETIGAAFFEPARSSIIPNIVPAEEAAAANALSSITWSFNLAIGATLGGLVAAAAGRQTVFLLNAVSFLVSAWLIRRMSFAEPHAEHAAPLRARDLIDYTPVWEGIRYIASDSRRLATVFVKGGIGVLGAHNVVLPVLGTREFAVHSGGLAGEKGAMVGMSLLLGARGLGALLGPLISGQWAGANQERMRRGIVAGFLLAAAGYLALAHAPSFLAAAIAVVCAHAGASSNWVFSTTLLQSAAQDRFRGRVFAADLGICMLTISVSSYLAGLAIDWGVAPRTCAMFIGCAMLLPAAAWWLAVRRTGRA